MSPVAFLLPLLALSLSPMPSYPHIPKQITDRPVIGILSLPLESDFPPTNATSYIAGSYVDWVESAGARVVPLKVDRPFAELEELFWQLNGVLFTGGSASFYDFYGNDWPKLSNYTKVGCFLYSLIEQANDKGIYMPLWATCLGFELIHICAYPVYGVLPNFDGDPAYVRNNTFNEAGKESRVFNSKMGQFVVDLMETEGVCLLSHNHGVAPREYEEYKNLSDAFVPMSTMVDKRGDEFVSMIEGVNYPIYGTQFHPEKNLFEWDPDIPIPHTSESALMSTYLAQFFISEARRNLNSFPSEEALTPLLIYNYKTYFFDSHLYQLYFLN